MPFLLQAVEQCVYLPTDPSPAHSATHMSHSSTLSVGTRERRLSWMALNADSDSNDEEKETDQLESPVVTCK